MEKIFPELEDTWEDWNGIRKGQDTRYPSFKRASFRGSFRNPSAAKGDSFKQTSSKRTSLGSSSQGGSFRGATFGSALRVLPPSGHFDLSGSQADGDGVAAIAGPTADAEAHSSDPPARTELRVAVTLPPRAPKRGSGHGGSDDSGAGQPARLALLERKVDNLLAASGKIETMEKQLSCLCHHFQVSLSVADDTVHASHATCES